MNIVLRALATVTGAGLAVVSPVAAGAVQDPVSCPPDMVGLANSSFEDPTAKGVTFLDAAKVPGWSTSASDGKIELWGPGNAWANRGTEVPAADGAQFAELNATRPSTLYQDVPTTPGQRLKWRIRHRARDSSPRTDTDIMQVLIGAPGTESPQTPSGASTPDIGDTEAAWGTWTGVYTVPAGPDDHPLRLQGGVDGHREGGQRQLPRRHHLRHARLRHRRQDGRRPGATRLRRRADLHRPRQQ